MTDKTESHMEDRIDSNEYTLKRTEKSKTFTLLLKYVYFRQV